MAMPKLYTHAGRILAFLDNNDGDFSPFELAGKLDLTPAQASTACSSLFLEGYVDRVGWGSGTRYLTKPSYPPLPAPRWLRRVPLVPCLGLRLC